jgi:RimJ/RimL family protein N-acetyltransferase
MFEDCGAARCVIDYHDWNEPAARLYTKLGFTEDVRIRIPEDKLTSEDREFAPDRPVYAVVVALTRQQFLGQEPG